MSLASSIQISSVATGATLSADQTRFNTLIRKIEQARRTLAAWNEKIDLYGQAYAKRVAPMLDACTAARREWIVSLDGLLDQPGWTKAERATLRDRIRDDLTELIDMARDDDPALKVLYEKHNGIDYETAQQEVRLAFKDFAAAVTGVDLGELTDITSDEALYERMQEGLAAAADERSSRAASARTSRRDRATEKRREAAAQLVAQSVREIFRKLASALHPDRELDPTRRDAKTALMQKVNQAYAANDLLGLLELQLQVAQIDAGHLASVGAERLKQFNQALSNQLNALKAELARVETEFRISTGMQPGFRLTPESLLKTIDRSVTAMRADLAMQKREMRMLADRAATRHWLKLERKRRRDDPFDLAF